MAEEAFDIDLVLSMMKEQKVTQTDMAKVMGLPSQSAFSNIIKGKRRVTAQEAAACYGFLGISIKPNVRFVPIIGFAGAGAWREAIEMPLGELPIPSKVSGDNLFAIEVVGDSMNLIVDDGGFVVIDPSCKELQPGKIYLIQNMDGEATIKLYQRSPDRFEPVSSNGEHKNLLVADHDFVVLGRAVWKNEPL